MTSPLVKTKLYAPPARPRAVARPRLTERLNTGLLSQGGLEEDTVFARKLTVVSAPAGFGKTTLMSEWARALTNGRPPIPVAWLSLDECDNDPARFLAYLIAAIQTVRGGIGVAAFSLLKSRQSPPVEAVLSMLINDVATVDHLCHDGGLCVLLLDDYHSITSQSVNQAVTFLLDHLPPRLHLALAGRADPGLPLARLRARGQMSEIRASDLRFTQDEVSAFLNDVMGLGLPAESIAALDARTEGWIAGLQMAALSLRGQGDADRFIASLSGSHRFILDFLVEEVLDRQPPATQDFLLKTAILDRMTAPLCDAVTGRTGSQAMLTQLDRANLFLVPLDAQRRWYRYHRLFADLLRTRLELSHAAQVPVLHRSASAWYSQNGLITEAVSHLLAAGDVAEVAELVEGNALAMMDRGELRPLADWLEALPEGVMGKRPWLSIAQAWTLAYVGEFDGVEQRLQVAERALVSEEKRTDAEHIAGHAATIRGYTSALAGGTSRTAELARKALELLPDEDSRTRGVAAAVLAGALKEIGDLTAATKAMAEAIGIAEAAGDSHVAVTNLCDLVRLQILQGRLYEAAATCQRALDLTDASARRSGWRLPVTGHVYTHLSRVLREWNDLEAAARLAKEGMELCRKWGWAELLVHGGIYLAGTLQAIGDTKGALEAIRSAKEAARKLSRRFLGLVEASEARLRLAQGDLAAAIGWTQRRGLRADDHPAFQERLQYVTLARMLVAQGRPDEALRLLARLLAVLEAAGAKGYVVETLVVQAVSFEAKGRHRQALTALGRALLLAEPEGYVRTFIDEGAPMRELLRCAAAEGISLTYVGRLLTVLETDARSADGKAQLVEPLSERELEVLRVLSTGLSNQEIAETLFIAVGTVKQHLKSIYAKLQVHSRIEAAHRARDLGIL